MNGYQMSKRKIKFNPERASYLFDLFNTSIPEKVDWRDEGFVTPVKDQVRKFYFLNFIDLR